MNAELIISYVNDQYSLSLSSADLLRESSDNQIWKLLSQPDSTGYFFRISKRDVKDDIAFEVAWMEILARSGVPVAPLVKTSSGMPFSTSPEVGTTTLFVEVPGKHLEFDKNTFPNQQQISSAAKALSDIHRISANVGVPYSRQRTIFTELSRVEKIKDMLDPQEPGTIEFLSAVNDCLEWGKRQQFTPVLIHNDYRVGNLLFEGDEVAAVLDFDWSCVGPAIKDVAHALAEWSYPDGADAYNEAAFDTFLDSYNSVALKPVAKNGSLYRWIAFGCLSDTATFLVDRIEQGQPKLPRQSYMFAKYKHFQAFFP